MNKMQVKMRVNSPEGTIYEKKTLEKFEAG